MKKVIDIYTPAEEVTVPYSVWTLLGFGAGPVKFNVSDLIVLGNGDRFGDSATINEWRYAINYLADQFGGEVTWKEEKK